MEFSTLLVLLYLFGGLWTVIRCVPWEGRTYFVGSVRSTAWPAQALGVCFVSGLVVTFWPLYFYLWLRLG